MKNVSDPRVSAPLRRPPRLDASVLVQTQRFFKDPFTLLGEAFKKHGDIFSVRILGVGEWVFLCSPELVREMFKAPPEVLSASEVNRSLQGFMLGDDATFTLGGDAHRQRQRQVYPHLNGRQIHQHVPKIREIALEALTGWSEDRPFAFLAQAHRMSLGVMMHALFGTLPAEEVARLSSLFDEYSEKAVRSPLVLMPFLQIDLGRFSPWGKILRRRRDIFETFAAAIARRAAQSRNAGVEAGEAGDIVGELALSRQHDGSLLSDQSLLHEAVNLLFAGHETTGNALAWIMETLHSHPEVLRRVRDELDVVLRGEPIEAEHLPELKYLHAVVHETFRYRPLAPMAGVRQTRQPFAVGGYEVPAGRFVTQCFPVMTRRPELFDNPDRFDPAHFYERKFRPFEWNPFGGGTRMCIGKGLAEVEIKVIMATLLRHAEFALAQKNVRPVRSGHFFAPNEGLQLTLEKRGWRQ